ncbi:MAG: hypothetical protein Barrevirus6_15 [Barrevirus sp.]|uniref:ATPase AAA-type core domain-containing protein n=1 Tax=Barrevirus sp. TaxID=2487763 RepID=A0A3G4ZQ19_9VIRU|nr:MAG: hypothetical protein Barrevirus6_15 [Barrevirus sp.]
MDPTTFALDWFRTITITDDLHVAAIDNLLLDKTKKMNISGLTKFGSRIVPDFGDHSIVFEGKPDESGSIKFICFMNKEEKNRAYKIDLVGIIAIRSIFKILNACRIMIVNESFINTVDNFILNEKNLCLKGNYIADVVPTPIDGIYCLIKDDSYLIAKRKTVKNNKEYTIDTVGPYYEQKLKTILNGDAGRIRVINCSIINDKINVRLINKLPMLAIHKSQETIINYVITEYKNSHNKNVTILISGNQGLGKSTVAFLIAQKLKADLNIDPYLIKGFNVMSNQMQYHPVIGHYSPEYKFPIILLLDEFDLAMVRADQNDDNNDDGYKDNLAIASNKTNLNNFLDAVNDESFMIMVATSNRTIQDIKNTFPSYCRKGRFTKHFEMIDKEVVNVFEP